MRKTKKNKFFNEKNSSAVAEATVCRRKNLTVMDNMLGI